MNDIFGKVRLYDPKEDENLPVFSYSKLDVYKKCPYRYKEQYIDGNREDISSLAMDLGTLCHYVLEQKGRQKVSGKNIDYNLLEKILQDGIIPESANPSGSKPQDKILGLTELRAKYYDDYIIPDKFGVYYDDKIITFKKVLHEEMEESLWTAIDFEKSFEIVYDNKFRLHGFIDRIDQKAEGGLRVIDYKTSKAPFPDKDLPTSMQFGIYALACYAIYGKVPEEFQYRFILIDKAQNALTKGWEKRLDKLLSGLFSKIENDKFTKIYKTCPSPLCYWCDYSMSNPNKGKYNGHCFDFSDWKPGDSFGFTKKEEVKSPVVKDAKEFFF